MSKHTPGPWSSKDIDNKVSIPLKAIYCERIGFSVVFVNGHGEEEAFANARLIAVAPELLEALQDCLAFLERDMPVASSGPERRKARAVIAKATGEQQ